MVECRRHERWRAREGVAPSRLTPSSKGGSGDLPRENLSAFWGQSFDRFLLTKMTESQTG